MRTIIFFSTLLGASTWAMCNNVEPNECQSRKLGTATCEIKMQATGLKPGLGDQLVTVVQVGDRNGSLRYFPENIVAPVGSIVQFHFNPRNHTVTESSFVEPCRPLAANLTNANRPGQRSGFVPVTPQDTDIKVFNMPINDTKPIWIYCGQGSHCQQGMVMVINQNPNDTEKTLDNFKAKAAQAPLRPGVPAPAPTSLLPGSGGVGGIVTPTTTDPNQQSSSTSSTTSTTSAPAGATNATTTTSRPAPGSGAVASGPASGTPAVLPGFANARSVPIEYAGLVALFVAGAATIL